MLHCDNCTAAIGRIYRTTARHLDEARDRFTLLQDKITSYQLGTGTLEAPPQPMTAVETRVTHLEDQTVKMMGMILLLNEKLEPDGGAAAAADAGPGSGGEGTGRAAARVLAHASIANGGVASDFDGYDDGASGSGAGDGGSNFDGLDDDAVLGAGSDEEGGGAGGRSYGRALSSRRHPAVGGARRDSLDGGSVSAASASKRPRRSSSRRRR